MKYLFSIILLLQAFVSFAQTEVPALIFPARHYADNVIFTHDEKYLITAGASEIKVWENETRRLLKNIILPPYTGDKQLNFEHLLTVSPDNQWLAFQNTDTLYLYDLNRFALVRKIKLANNLGTLVFTADGKTIYAGGREAEQYDHLFVQKFVLATGISSTIYAYTVKTLATHAINHLSLRPDGQNLLLYDQVMGTRIIDLNTNKLVKNYDKKTFPYTYLPNGNMLAFSGEKEKTLFLEELDANNGQSIRKSSVLFNVELEVDPLSSTEAFPINNDQLALEYQGEYRIFDVRNFTASSVSKFEYPGYGMNSRLNLRFAPSGKYYIMGITMGKYALPGDVYQGKYGYTPLHADQQFSMQHTDGLWLQDRALYFDPNGLRIKRFKTPLENAGCVYRLTADGKRGFVVVNTQGLYEFDPNSKELIYKQIETVPAVGLVGLRIFEAAGFLAAVANEGIYIVDLKNYKLRSFVPKPEAASDYVLYESGHNYICDLAPDKSRLLFRVDGSEGFDLVYCYDLVGKRILWQHVGNWIDNVRFENGGKTASFTEQDQLIWLDAATGTPNKATFQLPATEWWTTLAPSGKTAAVQLNNRTNDAVGDDLAIVDVTTQKQTHIIHCPEDRGGDVFFLRNERYLVTSESSGLSIYDLEKKRQVARILLFEETEDWLVFTPDGRFDASAGAMQKMYYSRGTEIIPLESLYEQYYVPGLLAQVWEQDLPQTLPNIKQLKALPTIKILFNGGKKRNDAKTAIYDANQAVANIQLEAASTGGEIAEIRLFHNGKLVESSTRNLIVEEENASNSQFNKSYNLPLLPGENTIRAVAINKQRTESVPAEMVIFLAASDKNTNTQGGLQLHLVVIGINTYKNPKYSLNYAQADALAFKEAIEQGAKSIFSRVNTTYITNEQATKAGIVAALDKVKATANPQDLFLFYYAGHGVINDQKAFFLVPQDVTQLYGNDEALAQKGLSANELQNYSKEIKAQKQLFILDACQSAGALDQVIASRGAAEEKAIAQLARSTGTHWLTASGSAQFASEFAQLGHGAFTYCLLEAFKGAGDTGDKKLTVKELDAYLQEKVPDVTARYKGSPQYPSSYGYGQDFPIITILR